ncbi:MAG: YkgJ family cysteine cluster protein [Treponema sp.]|jgi:Fe-S-cluster containining protein|nr:YkgJ family cysteine cluster protein [Treponema sp.]
MTKQPFYAEGLRFSCTRCSACCRYEPGYVFLTKKDVGILAAALKMEYNDFIEGFCRWIPDAGGRKRLSLKEKSNYDCIFWTQGCSVYDARPLQCRAFPFWPSMLKSAEAWKNADCPGMGKGVLHSMADIETRLEEQAGEPVVSKIT